MTPPCDSNGVGGPMLIGYLLNYGLHGVLCVQTYTYYLAFPGDLLALKVMVYAIFGLENIQAGLTAHDAYAMFASGLGDCDALGKMFYTWFSVPVLGGIVAMVGQLFFAYRLKVLSRSYVPTILVGMLSVGAAGAAMVSSRQTHDAKHLGDLKGEFIITAGVWNGGCAVCDVLIAGCMSYYLSRHQVIFPRTRRKITRLARVTIETGILTATIAILSFILLISKRHVTYFMTPILTIAKLYSNTMLVLLNNRITVIGGRDDIEDESRFYGETQLDTRWRLRKRVRQESAISNAGDVGGIMVLTEILTDAEQNENFEVLHKLGRIVPTGAG